VRAICGDEATAVLLNCVCPRTLDDYKREDTKQKKFFDTLNLTAVYMIMVQKVGEKYGNCEAVLWSQHDHQSLERNTFE
jgi:hypothetical protein